MSGAVSKDTAQDAAGHGIPPCRRKKRIIFLLCVLAAVHVFVFSAAFPFFTNVDEPWHFDLIVRYSHGLVPRGLDTFSQESSLYMGLFNSLEYVLLPGNFVAGKYPPPVWTLPPNQARKDLLNRSGWCQLTPNYEVSQAPLYYALAGACWHAGQWLGIQGGRWLYTLRFLNILCVAALVWLGYLAARTIFPENLFLQIGVPAWLAFLPQTQFYTLGNDTLSSLCFGVTFIYLLKWLSAQTPALRDSAATGLAFAATYLSKTTTLPLLAVAVAVVVMKSWQSFREGKWRAAWPSPAAFFACATPPIIAWMLWCQWHFGDLTGSKLKIQSLGWTVKPFSQWWHHPIFTPSGLWTYLSGQLGTFWQGEIWWHNHPLVLPGTNVIYTLLSIVLFIAVLPSVLPRFSTVSAWQREGLRLCMACFIAGLGFFALLSIIYDFHNNLYPSRQHPYFTSGRLLLGALIPFLLLMVYGLDRMLGRMGNAAKFLTLTAMILAMLLTEIATDWPVFSSAYNWFHLP